MPETEPRPPLSETQIEVWRLALAALESERARLLAKYDRRIAELKKAIKQLEREQARQPQPARGKTAAPPGRSRKTKPGK